MKSLSEIIQDAKARGLAEYEKSLEPLLKQCDFYSDTYVVLILKDIEQTVYNACKNGKVNTIKLGSYSYCTEERISVADAISRKLKEKGLNTSVMLNPVDVSLDLYLDLD